MELSGSSSGDDSGLDGSSDLNRRDDGDGGDGVLGCAEGFNGGEAREGVGRKASTTQEEKLKERGLKAVVGKNSGEELAPKEFQNL
ncbi:hypothetical protein DM860_003897 [Cuscuta australis]|uniref:Uncharacterized protein n=1 Tax=Cuscuta australis TaxID=267555 RepID=A0A328CUZ1_9ASTE|nr:hypothetical protein DM860_003897 [Cuscuta australis]